MFKKISLILLVVVMMFSVASCGAKQKVNDKIAEKVTEGVINKATGGDANVDIDGDKISVQGKDGEKVTFGETKWPDNPIAIKLPEFKAGKIISSVITDQALMVIVEGADLEDFQQYVEKLKEKGYVNDPSEMSSSELYAYSASSDEGIVYVQYGLEGKTTSISLEIKE